MYHDKLKKEYDKLDKEIKSIESKIKKLPPDKIIVSKNGNNYKWIRSDGKNHVYIPKQDRQLAEKLAAKKYLVLKQNDLKQKRQILNTYLRLWKDSPDKAEQLLMNPAYHELLSPFFQIQNSKLLDWIHAPYDRNNKYPEHLTLKSISGNLVRSKSELMIDMSLFSHQIPFRYECALELGEIVVYPDFTIFHPVTEKIYYWEHFGMMDNPTYRKNAFDKLNLYAANNIYPFKQLIITCETKEQPLDTEVIQRVIDAYFV